MTKAQAAIAQRIAQLEQWLTEAKERVENSSGILRAGFRIDLAKAQARLEEALELQSIIHTIEGE